ncbi:DUF1499 domain-containing protein [Zhongshania borealis]|uniref:DUF1499 domain-containing protein n=1 Tax=Zhongshania borealis TaxID=889488 RepID=A0ABP7WT47_9GAMM
MRTLLILFTATVISACSNTPTQTGSNSTLAPCPNAPHCVSSVEAGSKHITAITVTSAEQWQLLQETLLAMPRTNVAERRPNYLHAVSHSAIMRYRDDVELRYTPANNRVDVRSASRLGYYDFEVNRERIETLRNQFNTTKHD